ncbi:MAG: alanine racemase [Candidatus Melainabacteria bacterium]|nr:alanine racemase [Candidatus Melainabacteria bacterium]
MAVQDFWLEKLRRDNLLKHPDFDTPALLLDLDLFVENAQLAFSALKRINSKTKIRPHCKSIKSPQLARILLNMGANGICVAKLSEAEVMMNGGIDDILVTTEIAGPTKLTKLMILAARNPELKIVVDNHISVATLSDWCAKAGLKHQLKILIDINVGQNRCGIEPDCDKVLALTETILASGHLQLIGLQGYEGHIQQAKPEQMQEHCLKAMQLLTSLKLQIESALKSREFVFQTITTGGTGSFLTCATNQYITEVQPGSFCTMDSSYKSSNGTQFANALAVATTVISTFADRIVVDAGLKSLSTDMGNAKAIEPYQGYHYSPAGDEHGILSKSEAPSKPDTPSELDEVKSLDSGLKPGDLVILLPSHCDTTLNLHDHLFLVGDEETLKTQFEPIITARTGSAVPEHLRIDRKLKIEGRGKSQ